MSRSSRIRAMAWIVIAGVLGVGLAVPASSLAVSGGNPPSVECGDLDLYFKIDDIADTGIKPGVYTGASAHVETNWAGQTITISGVTAGGQAFDWASAQRVAKVVWKEATGIYSTTDGLPGYAGSVGDRTKHGISHVVFCGRETQPTVTPTPSPVTETATPTSPPETETATPTSPPEAETATPTSPGKERATPPATDITASGTTTPPWLHIVALLVLATSALLLASAPRSPNR